MIPNLAGRVAGKVADAAVGDISEPIVPIRCYSMGHGRTRWHFLSEYFEAESPTGLSHSDLRLLRRDWKYEPFGFVESQCRNLDRLGDPERPPSSLFYAR